MDAAPSPVRRSWSIFSLQDGGRDVSQSYTHYWCTSSFFSLPQNSSPALLQTDSSSVCSSSNDTDIKTTICQQLHILGKSCWSSRRRGGNSFWESSKEQHSSEEMNIDWTALHHHHPASPAPAGCVPTSTAGSCLTCGC